jgi:3-hydroxyisobutyrate dehydrogenase/2-hydroxy-3-oxopropionate reductase
MTTAAVVGLGAMGSRIASRLLEAGFPVLVWNRTPAKAEGLVARGASAVATPGEAARRADVVITMVADPAALEAVTEGTDGIAAGAGETTAVIEMSTVGPSAISRLAQTLPSGRVLDAPVLGSMAEAESGSLRIFVGGPAELVEEWTPLLSTLGSPLHVGPLGAGAAAKLVANTTLFGTLGVLGEALALADGLGLSRDTAFEVLASTPLAAQAERRRPSLEAGEYPSRFSLSLARKDADLVAEAGAAAGVDLRVVEAARSWLVEAEQAGLGGADYSGVLARILEPASTRQAVVSTTVRSIGYRDGTLEIEFVSGNVYRYFDVPEGLFREFMGAPSKGTFFNERIRDRFRSEGPL